MGRLTDIQVNELREQEIAKRIEAGRTGRFQITPTEGDHPFYTLLKVRGSRYLTYQVEIHSLTDLHENYCTCGDYRHNELQVCKHIVAALEHLKEDSPEAFEWTRSKTPYQEEALYPRWTDGREVLYLRTQNSDILSRAQNFFNNNNELYDFSVFEKSEWKQFLELLDSHGITVTPMAQGVMDRWERISKLRNMVAAAIPDGIPADLMRHKAKKYQVEAATQLIKKGKLVLNAPQGAGKRVAAMLAMAFIERNVGPHTQYVIVGPSHHYTQWRLLMDLFLKHPIHRLSLRGGRKRLNQMLSREKFFFASYETILRDGWIINQIEPAVLVFDEIQTVERWHGSTGSVLKSLEAPYMMFLTHGLEAYPELTVNLAQFVEPHGMGPMWLFMAQHAHRDARGRITGYDLDIPRRLLESYVFEIFSRSYKAKPKRPRLRLGVQPSKRQKSLWETYLKKLTALTAVKYAWEEREAEHARELVRSMRLLGGRMEPEGTDTPKMEVLKQILRAHALEKVDNTTRLRIRKPGHHLSKRVVIFTHWPELVGFIKDSLESQGYSVFVLKEDGDLARWEDHTVAVMYDKPYNPQVSGVELLIHYDWPWEKDILEKGRRALVSPPEEERLVEVTLFTRASIEDVGVRIMENSPTIIGEWFDASPVTRQPSVDSIRTICTRLSMLLNERHLTGRYRVHSGPHSKRRSRSRLRVPMLGKGTEIENPGSFVRPKNRFRMDSIFDSGPRAIISKQLVWDKGIAMPDFSGTSVLCDVKRTPRGHLTSAQGITKKSFMAWKADALSRMALALNKANFIIATEELPAELRSMLFGVKIFNILPYLSEQAGMTLTLAQVLEGTLDQKPQWDDSKLMELASSAKWSEIASLSKEDLKNVWKLLVKIHREGKFSYTDAGSVKDVPADLSAVLPEDILDHLREGTDI